MKTSISNKSFGLTIGFFSTLVFFYFFYITQEINIYLVTVSLFFLILGVFNSSILTPFNIIWVKFGDLLGIIVSPIVMMVVYFGVIFPTKIILRLFKKDILNLKTDKTAKTFWIESSKKFNSMNNQF